MSWLNAVSAATGLFLLPFGGVGELVQTQNPWLGFESNGPVLWVVRAQEMKSESCEKWIQALQAEVPGTALDSSKSQASWRKARKAWEPWSSQDLKSIVDCDSFPCEVKLNRFETAQIKSSKSDQRLETFLELGMRRSLEYEITQKRKEYEFPGNPVDPWALLETHGFVSRVPRPKGSLFFLRKMDFAPGKIRTIRQILDRRMVKDPSGLEATVWIRDAYTDHYFDSWGEWSQVSCDKRKAINEMYRETFT